MRTLEKHLRDNYSHNELADCAKFGCQGGFGDFIYYSDTVRYFEQFKEECFEIIEEYNEEMGVSGFPKYINDNMWEKLYTKAKKDIIICLDGDAYDDAKKLYDKLNGGALYNRVKLVKLPKDKDVCDLRGDITPYYIQEKE